VLIDLRALVARQHVLEVEPVELEVLLEPAPLERARALDLDPAQALAGDRLYVRLLALRRRRRRGELAAARPSQPGLREVRHRSGSSLYRRRRTLGLRVRHQTPCDAGERASWLSSGLRSERLAPGIFPGHITATSRGVEGLARRSPGNPPGRGKVPTPAGGLPGRCEGESRQDLCSQPGGGLFTGRDAKETVRWDSNR